MTAEQTIEGLRQTGTRGKNLAILEGWLEQHKSAGGQELIEFMAGNNKVSPVTLAKAKHLASGQPIDQLLGKPPPSLERDGLGKLAQIAETMEKLVVGGHANNQHAAQEAGVGRPAPAVQARVGGK